MYASSTAITAHSSGTKIAALRYTPWGETRYTSNPTPTSFQYTGQRKDATGLYFYNARYYDPALGRFLAADTLVPDPTQPQTLNRYAYALNNPLRYTDPTGHCVWDACLLETALVVGGLALIADYGVQVWQNVQSGQPFFEAADHTNIDEGEMLVSGGVGFVSGLMIAGGLPLVAEGAGGIVETIGSMGVQGGVGMVSSEAGYLASSITTGHDTDARELFGVSTVGGAANAINAVFPSPLPSTLIQGTASAIQYATVADQPSVGGALLAAGPGAVGGAASSMMSQQLTTASSYSGHWPPAALWNIAPKEAAYIFENRMLDGTIMAGAEFLRSFWSTLVPELEK